MLRLASLLTALALLAPMTGATAQDTVVDQSDNVEQVFSYAYDGVDGEGTAPYFNAGTDLAFDGDIVIAPQQGDDGKIHLFQRVRRGPADRPTPPGHFVRPRGPEDTLELVGTIPCVGGQNDVAVVESGLLAVAYHDAICGEEAEPGSGVSLHDITNPAEPLLLGAVHGLPGGTHTLTVHPSEPIIYASPGGIANGGGVQQILDVSKPDAPVVAGTYLPNAAGCHDFSVVERDDLPLGICVGLTETQLWDLSDPFAPMTISHIVNPLIQFHHTGVTTADGKLLVIGDETLVAQECLGGPTGAMFAYDISDPLVPVPLGYFAVDRNAGDNPVSAQDRTNWCTAHIFSFVGESRTMVASWYTGGMTVIDWSDPMAPREVAHHAVDSGDREGTVNYWSAYFHDGLVYANDRGRGALDVLRVDGLTDGGLADAASTRTGQWTSGPIADAPPAMHAHAQRRALLQQGTPDRLVCVLLPGSTAITGQPLRSPAGTPIG
jgi:hypothetical protein